MLYNQIQEAAAAIRSRWAKATRVGVILGTGLGALAQDIATDAIMRSRRMIGCPIGRGDATRALVRATVPRIEVPSLMVTVPTGVPAPGAMGLTIAV